jgi:hypothetical protein
VLQLRVSDDRPRSVVYGFADGEGREEGHRSSDCTNERVIKCRNCDERGHSGKECPKPRDMARVKCNNCGESEYPAAPFPFPHRWEFG